MLNNLRSTPLLGTHYVPRTIVGTENPTMNKIVMNSAPMEVKIVYLCIEPINKNKIRSYIVFQKVGQTELIYS